MCTSPPARGQRWFILGLLLLFVALSVRYSFKVLANRSAFVRWQPQVQEMGHGVDIAQRHNYPNPPVMAVLLEPLARLPPLAAALTWFYLKVGLTLLALRWVFEIVEDPQRPFPPWARAAAVLLSLKPILDDLNHGNVNLFILFLVVAFLAAFRRRRDLLAGVVLGLAVACKVTPALFIPYLLWKRAWRALAGTAVGLALFLYPGVVPALRLGPEANRQQLASWYLVMVHPFVVEGQVWSEHNNQSIPGLVARLATHRPSFAVWVENVYTPTRYDNFLDLSDTQARWLVKGLMAVFALVFIWSCRTPTTPRHGWRLAAEFSLVVLGMLLFSERTWKHHCVTLALPFAVLCYYVARCRPPPAVRGYLGATLAGAFLLMAVTGLGAARRETSLGKQAELYGAYVVVCLLLAASLVVLLRTPRKSSPAAHFLGGENSPGEAGKSSDLAA
jgi:hypothetical protein